MYLFIKWYKAFPVSSDSLRSLYKLSAISLKTAEFWSFLKTEVLQKLWIADVMLQPMNI